MDFYGGSIFVDLILFSLYKTVRRIYNTLLIFLDSQIPLIGIG